jgi:hypothetical protein
VLFCLLLLSSRAAAAAGCFCLPLRSTGIVRHIATADRIGQRHDRSCFRSTCCSVGLCLKIYPWSNSQIQMEVQTEATRFDSLLDLDFLPFTQLVRGSVVRQRAIGDKEEQAKNLLVWRRRA